MTVANIPLDRAYLTAIWLETLFYGMNIVLFGSYLFVSRYKRKQPKLNRRIMATAICMFLFSTTHVSLGFQRLIEGFVVLRNQPGGPAAFFSDVSIPANVAKICIHTINSILGDSIVVWRCYHVWGQSLLICTLPILMILGSAISGFAQTYFFATAKTTHTAFAKTLAHWNGAVFSLSLATNVIVTSLIAARIWYLERQLTDLPARNRSLRYKKVLALVIESGAIYSSALVIEITLYFLNTNAFYIVYDPIAQLTGIVPTMIIVLTNLGLTTNDLNSTFDSNEFKAPISFMPVGETVTTTSLSGEYSMQGTDNVYINSRKAASVRPIHTDSGASS